MVAYISGGTADVDGHDNRLLLRADMHAAFDMPKFVFFPKPGNAEARQFAVHFVQPSIELGPLYHNRGLHTLAVRPELLFARFAWTIFPSLVVFLQGRATRYLQLRTPADDDGNTKISPVSAVQCQKFVGELLPSRGSSPRKRRRTEDSEADEAGCLYQRAARDRGDSQTAISSTDAASVESLGTSLNIEDEDSPGTAEGLDQCDGMRALREDWLREERLRSDVDEARERGGSVDSCVERGDCPTPPTA
jgi:hypothetical protein